MLRLKRIGSFNKNFVFHNMLQESEKHIRFINRNIHRARYEAAVAHLDFAPSYDDLYERIMKIGIDENLPMSYQVEGHLFYKSKRYSAIPDLHGFKGLRFIHWVKILIDDSVTDVRHIKNISSCKDRFCVNPDHCEIELMSVEEFEAEAENRIRLKKEKERINLEEKEKNMLILADGSLNLKRWKNISYNETTLEARNLSRNLCHTRKVSFYHREQANGMKNAVNSRKRKGKNAQKGGSYKCACGYWHITSNLYSDQKTRKLVKRAGVVY